MCNLENKFLIFLLKRSTNDIFVFIFIWITFTQTALTRTFNVKCAMVIFKCKTSTYG